MIKPDIDALKKRIKEVLGTNLGTITDKDGIVYPGLEIANEPDSDLEYRGVVGLIKPLENGEAIPEFQGFHLVGNIEIHFIVFSGKSDQVLVPIWNLLQSNFEKVTKQFIPAYEQYGQTGKLIVYFHFNYRV